MISEIMSLFDALDSKGIGISPGGKIMTDSEHAGREIEDASRIMMKRYWIFTMPDEWPTYESGTLYDAIYAIGSQIVPISDIVEAARKNLKPSAPLIVPELHLQLMPDHCFISVVSLSAWSIWTTWDENYTKIWRF